ncbi:manno-octulosonate cytidylyltransferase [Alisedimentitalea sp. MJ-SS2]|uniref:3-deoxy-manno-octulosonate cytidylyltransferase n=1 Tax=Aliisedimentitalea sp. MJ-SS2 TaxID=3049795 RepID=UPI00290D573C|nr:manno-octulosonate cytidylyltransferase [Alisedimentitalea sp. MJ-SS2]MDU8930048.1 manno-octulosonate cytidylyltransferase [Alisedimentitalea sp. MJ-SS2]
MKTVIIIPARYASQRYPGKPLVELRDRDGQSKSLIRRSWEAAMAVPGIDGVYVATDDERIRDAAEAFGAQVIMTSESCRNGTERCADALAVAGIEADLVINLQGDSPLTPAWFVEDLVKAMAERPDMEMATPVLRCDAQTYAHFVADRKAGRVGGTTAVFGTGMRAIYFSKEVIPYIDPDKADSAYDEVFHHVGLYAYRPDALARYVTWAPGRLEGHEGLEQLRFLENGVPVLCVEVEGKGRVFWELNNPEDVARIESILMAEGEA